MKTLKDILAPKNEKKIKNPFNFDAPHYDERSSCFINAGTHHGVGHRQPVGKKGNPAVEADTLPMDRRNVKTIEYDGHYDGKMTVQVDE